MAKVNSPSENVRALQRALYVAAKRNSRRKFPALLDRIARQDVLRDAWEQVRRNRGAAGIDGETLAAVEAYGVEQMLRELRELLLTGRYRPQPSRRVYTPKPGRPGEERPLSIPSGAGSGCSDRRQAGARAHLRGQLLAVVLRLSAQAQRPPGAGADPEDRESGRVVGGGLGLPGLLRGIDTLLLLLIEIVEEGGSSPRRRLREFNSEPLTPSRAQVQGPQLSALYTLQHRLSGDPQRLHCLPHRHPAWGCLFDELRLDVVTHSDVPGSARRGLFGGDEAVTD